MQIPAYSRASAYLSTHFFTHHTIEHTHTTNSTTHATKYTRKHLTHHNHTTTTNVGKTFLLAEYAAAIAEATREARGGKVLMTSA
jgi:hypothetical protein